MSLLDKASLIVTPNSYKESKLYSVIPNTTLGDMDVVRATTATRVNEQGLIEVVPRNLLTYSEQFDNAAWTKISSTITANSIAAPNGTLTADKFESTSVGTPEILQATSNVNLKTISFYAKAGNVNFISLWIGSEVKFNLSLGTVVTGTATIENVGNGWYRCIVSNTTFPNFNPFFSSTASGQFVYIWGAQFEQGSTATTYFPTTTRLNIPRIDYTNGSCPSLLVEPQRTNLQLYSENFTNAAWAANLNASASENLSVSPNGILSADKIIEDTSNSQHFIGQTQSGLSGISYTISLFAKAAERSFLFLFEDSGGGRNAYFDLSNGTIGNVGSSATASIESFGNGWYRCSVTYTSTATLIRYRVATALSNGVNSYLGDGTSGLFIWGAEIEAGSYATSYIPTVASSVTRNADVISKTGISSLIGQTEGTVFIDCIINGVQNSPTNIINSNFSTNASFYISRDVASKSLTAGIFVNGINNNIFAGIVEIGNKNRIALVYKSGSTKLFLNGILIGTNTNTFNITTLISELYLNTNVIFTGYQGDLSYNLVELYKTALTDTECIALTTI